jgi:hypothetical protein
VCLTGAMPVEIQLKPLPSEAQELAPQLRGFTYVVVDELITLVDPRTRKVESCFEMGRAVGPKRHAGRSGCI